MGAAASVPASSAALMWSGGVTIASQFARGRRGGRCRKRYKCVKTAPGRRCNGFAVDQVGEKRLSARLLGGLEVRRDGAPVRFPTRHAALLFAILAVEPGVSVARARIAGLLWPTRADEQARGSLRQTLHRLRRALGEAGDCVEADAASIRLDPGAVASDAAALAEGRLDVAALSPGLFLEGWDDVSAEFGEWVAERREAMKALAADALRRAAGAADAAGDHPAAARLARRILALEPYDEEAARLRIAALAASGRRAEALAAHEDFAGRLEADLGARPEIAIEALAASLHTPHSPPPPSASTPPPAAAAPRPGARERRQVTIVAANVGPADGAPADPEEIAAALAAVEAAMARVAPAHGGVMERAPGLALLAVFGWPDAQEDTAARALRAAADIRLAAGEAAPDLRLGVATGDVIAAPGGGLVGSVPDTALRLASLALPGVALVAPATRGLTAGAFEFAEEGPNWEPSARALLGPRALESRFAARSVLGVRRLIGRARELDLLLDLWRLASQGEGQIAVIRGEAGIGKSHLAEALAGAVSASGGRRVLLQCSPHAVDEALGPLVDHLKTLVGLGGRGDAKGGQIDPAAAVARLAANCEGIGAEEAEALATFAFGASKEDAEARRAAAMSAAMKLLQGADPDRPSLIVIEDAHWADPTSLDLLRRVAAECGARRVLIVLTARPEYDHGDLPDGNLTAISLRGLTRGEAEALIREVMGAQAPSDAFLETAVERADGVPLFAEEIARAALETALDTGPAAADAPPPGALRDILGVRLDRLGPHKEIAQRCACVGRRFSVALVVEAFGEPERAEAAIAAMIEARIVFSLGPAARGVHAFRHALVRDAAYDSLTRERRRAMHGALYDALAASEDAEPGDLARHAAESGRREQAAEWLRMAGLEALGRFAHREARSLFARALALLDGEAGPPSDAATGLRLELMSHLGLCEAHARGYSHPDTLAALEAARRLALATPSSPHAIPVLWQSYSAHYTAAEAEKARDVGLELLRLPAWNDAYGPQAALGLRFVAAGDMLLGRFAEAEDGFRRAEAALDARPDLSPVSAIGVDSRVAISLHSARVAVCRGRQAEARRRLAEADRLARASGGTHSLIMNAVLGGLCLLIAGDRPGALRLAAEAQDLTGRSETSMWRRYAELYGALAAARERPWEETQAACLAARAGLDQTGTRVSAVFSDARYAEEAAAADRLEEAERAIAAAFAASRAGVEPWCAPEIARIEALVGRSTGRITPGGANALLADALGMAERMGADLWVARIRGDLVETA